MKDAAFERRSCGNGSKGPRYSDWAMTATSIEGQFLLIRGLISRPEQLNFYLCSAPPGRPATMTYYITIAGRRWPVEETFKTEKTCTAGTSPRSGIFEAICRHTALAALAQLRAAAIRSALSGSITLPPPPRRREGQQDHGGERDISDADLQIPLGDAPVPDRGGLPCPPGIGPIKLSIAETIRLTGLASAARRRADHPRPARLRAALVRSTTGCHQAAARWHHYSARLLAATTG